MSMKPHVCDLNRLSWNLYVNFSFLQKLQLVVATALQVFTRFFFVSVSSVFRPLFLLGKVPLVSFWVEDSGDHGAVHLVGFAERCHGGAFGFVSVPPNVIDFHPLGVGQLSSPVE